MTRSRITRRAALGAVTAASLPTAFARIDDPAAARTGPMPPAVVPAFSARLDTAPLRGSGTPQQVLRTEVWGGVVAGPRLQGPVTSGVLECTFDAAGAPARIKLQFAVRTPSGAIVHVDDEGLVHAGPDGIPACCSRPQLLESAGAYVQRPALFVARMGLTGLQQGSLELIVHEVMH